MTDHTIVLYDHDKSPADLVAEAIARLQKEKLDTETWLANEESWTSQDDIDHARYYLRIVDCHLAEFEEHERTGYSEQETDEDFCEKCEGPYQKNILYPCNFTTTKAKRLLGKE